MIKVDESDPIGELEPSFPYRDVVIKRNVEMKEFYDLESEIGRPFALHWSSAQLHSPRLQKAGVGRLPNIGVGKFGTVYRCREKSTGLTLAAKFVGIARKQERRNVEREVEIMRCLQHPRLIQLYDAFESSNVMCVIQELVTGGELFERVIDDDFILTEKACTVFLRQICEGVAFIHSKNILHLDLKPENILCLTKTGNRIKIIDFGLARHFDPGKKLQVLFGTPEFVAPEVVNFDQIGFGTDMWSIGVICYVLLSGLSPFMGETDVETMANVTIAQYDFDDEAFDDISDSAKDFISKLLLKDKERRLTASECLSHVWLRRKPLKPVPAEIDKENIKNFVDRWNEQPRSPTVVKVIPTDTPTIIEKLLPSPTPPIVVVPLIQDKKEKRVQTNNHKLPKLSDLPNPVTNNVTPISPIKVENKASKEKENNEKNLPNLKLVVTNKPDELSSPTLKQNSAVFPRPSSGVKNAGDLESPNPSKQPKVDLNPVKSKALPEKSSSNSTINSDKVNNNHKKDDNKKGDAKKDDEIKVSTYYMPKKPPHVPNLSPKKSEDNSIHTFNLKPSPSAPNVNTLNSRIQSGRTEISISKTLTNHPQPKIAGIVLGQTLTPENKDKSPVRDQNKGTEITNKLPKCQVPRIITHKINIEGKTENIEEKKKVENGVPPSKPPSVTHAAGKETKQIPIEKGKVPLASRVNQLSVGDRFERRSSDISCFLHDTETVDGINLAEEIKKLSARLFQMSSDQSSVDNNRVDEYIPTAYNVRDPIRQFLANHGVVTRRPKFRVSNLNRDVPIGSPPPPSNFTYYVSHMTDPSSSSEIKWIDSQTHSAPQSPRSSPNRFPEESLTKEVILRLFDKAAETPSKNQSESIDSLTSYFKKSNVTQKKLPTVIPSK